MYQNDYILREIEGLTRFLAKVLLHREMDTGEVIDEDNLVSESGFFRHTLFRMLDSGRVCEAEDLLHERIEADPRREYLQIALDFYARLNERSDEDLENCDFSREEIVEGLADIKQHYIDL